MANESQRYREGPQSVARGKIKAGVKAGVGDLMFKSSDEYLYPASTIAVDGSGSGSGGGFTGGNALTDFKGAFIGTLIEGATTGLETVDSDCLVGYGAVYEYDLNAASDANYAPGHPIEAYATGGKLANQTVQLVSARTNAFATLAKELRTGDLTAFIQTQSSVMQNPLA